MTSKLERHLAQPENRIFYLLSFSPEAEGGWDPWHINERLYHWIGEAVDEEAHY